MKKIIIAIVCSLISLASLVPLSTLAASKCSLQLSVATTTTSSGTTYTYGIKNAGVRQCADVSLSVFYDVGESLVDATPLPTSSDYYWYVGKLGAKKTTQIIVTTDATTPRTTDACASATGSADACTANTTTPSISPVTDPVVPPLSQPSAPTTSPEYGIWVWDSPYALGNTAQTIIDEIAQNGFTSLYITLDDYLPISQMAAGTAKTAAINAYTTAVTSFLSYANQKGIAVDAEAGDRDWAKPANRIKAFTILDYVATYNATHATKFRNMQYDIEPYLLPEYETNKAAVLTDYVTFVQQLITKPHTDLGLELVIPHFYDSNGWTPLLTLNGVTGSTYDLVLSALDQVPSSSIIVMAYRDYVAGAGGTIDISKDEVNGAAGHSTRVVIAQETGNVDPAYVTFYGQPKSDLMNALAAIKQTYAQSSGFGGVSVHYLDPFLALK